MLFKEDIDKLVKELKRDKKEGDWEAFHSDYDKIVGMLARESHPETMKKLDKIIKGGTFWYA